MKTAKFIIAMLSLLALVLVIIVCWSTPRRWAMTPESITAKKILIEGEPFIEIDGEPMNHIGQIQTINVEFDSSGKHLMVTRCLILWNPFTKMRVNNQWPVFYPVAQMPPGKYSVTYDSSDGPQTAGTFVLP